MKSDKSEQVRRQIQFSDGDEMNGYKIVSRDGLIEVGRVASPINRGGAGVVYRACFKDSMERAIKMLSPRDEWVSRDTGFREFEKTFDSEIALLSRVTHTYIAKIMDYGEWRPKGSKKAGTKYYVMEYIDGVRLNEVWADPDCTGSEFLNVIGQILEAIEYLHSPFQSLDGHAIMHTDIKEANIIVRKHLRSFTATLVDLGVAKLIPLNDNTVGSGLTEDTYFFATQRATHSKYQGWIGKKVAREEVRKAFPFHDLYGVGIILKHALEVGVLQETLRRDLGSSGLRALHAIRDNLIRLEYDSIRRLREDWQKVRPEYLSPVLIPELSLAPQTVMTVPSGRIGLTERVTEVINHPLFQRLRHLPQLSFEYLLYPGARHSKLLHSLSNFTTARQYLSYLLNDPSFRLMTERSELEATLLQALLRDIGHYPLAHIIEDLNIDFGMKLPSRHGELFWAMVRPSVKHDQVYVSQLARIVQEKVSESTARADVFVPQFHDLLTKHFSSSTLDSLQSILEPKTASQRILAGVIESGIGVNRVAYLQDDSMMTGVPYGSGIDLPTLLTSLQAPLDSDIGQNSEPVIAISDKGLPAAESAVLARYWMLHRVYWHHTNRAVMAMFKFVIGTLAHAHRFDFTDYFSSMLFATEIDAARLLASRFDSAVAEGAVAYRRRIRNPLNGLLDSNRALYKRIAGVSRGSDWDADRRLYDSLVGCGWSELVQIADEVTSTLERILGRSSMQAGDVIIDVPHDMHDEYMKGDVFVYLQSEPDRGRKLATGPQPASPILQRLRDAFDHHVKMCRIYVHPSVMEQINSPKAIDHVQKEVIDLLHRRLAT